MARIETLEKLLKGILIFTSFHHGIVAGIQSGNSLHIFSTGGNTSTKNNPPSTCLPIKPKREHLPSEEIVKTALVDANNIIAKYPSHHTKSKVRMLATKLALKSYFVECVLKSAQWVVHVMNQLFPSKN